MSTYIVYIVPIAWLIVSSILGTRLARTSQVTVGKAVVLSGSAAIVMAFMPLLTDTTLKLSGATILQRESSIILHQRLDAIESQNARLSICLSQGWSCKSERQVLANSVRELRNSLDLLVDISHVEFKE